MLLTVSDGINSFVQFLTVLILFLFVLVITYFTTRYIAGIEKNKYTAGNMELIETLRISNNKYLQILKIGSRYLCIAVCKDTVTMLAELNEEEIKEISYNSPQVNFQNILEKMKVKNSFSKKETEEENRP